MFNCDQCLKEFTHRPSLIRHKRTLHAISEVKECEICCKVIKSNFKRHFASCKKKNENVTFVPLFECNICSKKFPWKKTLQKHKELHIELKSLECLKCEKSLKLQII